MEKNTIAIVLVALLVGLGGGYWARGERAPEGSHVMSDGAVMTDDSGMTSAMGSMTAGLMGKTGDAFDREFLLEMITHHQGAVDMAKQALTDANHAEIKQMAQDIITAQTKEIGQMQGWQKSWYGAQ